MMIKADNISKVYQTPHGPITAVAETSFEVKEKEIFGIIGFSGAGKSTLLRMINMLEKPNTGKIEVNGEILTTLKQKKLRTARHSIGIIFQHFNLLANRTVSGNVSFALELAGVPKQDRPSLIKEALDIVDLEDKAKNYPAQLSGGQKQRVAIARAISTRPNVLLCDEPTSALDPKTTQTILSYLKKINDEYGVTILLVTHELDVVRSLCSRVAVMDNGKIIETLHLNEKQVRKPLSKIGQLLINPSYEGVKASV